MVSLIYKLRRNYKSAKGQITRAVDGRTDKEYIYEYQKKLKNKFIIYSCPEAAITNTLKIYPFYASILLVLLLCFS
jgi:hypothetical protein